MGIREIVLLLLGIISVALIIVFTVYFAESEARNKECENYYAKNGVKSFTLVYNSTTKKVISYQEGKQQNSFSIEMMLSKKDITKFNNWLKKIYKDKDYQILPY